MKIEYSLEDRSSNNAVDFVTILSKLSVPFTEEISVDVTPIGLRGAQGAPGSGSEWQSLAW